MPQDTVSNFIMEYLKSRGTRYIFGIISHSSFDLGDALSRTEGIQFINSAHEGGSGNMALGYARSTKLPGVCLVSAGGGVTNLTTPIAQAYKESVPLIAISSEVETSSSYRGAASWHDIDHVNLLRPITKSSIRLERAEDITHLINQTYRLATTGRRGPVYLGIPTDLQSARISSEAPLPSSNQPSSPSMNTEFIERTAEALIQSSAPIMLIGTGVYWAGAEVEVQELAQLLNIPVATSYTAKGLFPDHNPLALGCLGAGGRPYAREAVFKADLILALGTTFSEGTMMGFDYKLIPPSAKIIHIDIDPEELEKNFTNYTSIQSDAKAALHGLLKEVKSCMPSAKSTSKLNRAQAIRNKKSTWKQEQEQLFDQSKITKPSVYRILSELSTEHHIFVTAGVTGSLLTHIDAYNPIIHAGEFRAIGTALATALGVKLGQPEKRIICVTGDGSFLMEQQELATARLHNIPILIVVLRNNAYGGMKRDQNKHYEGRILGTDLFIPDLHKLSRLFGAKGEKITAVEELRSVIKRYLSSDDLAILDVKLAD